MSNALPTLFAAAPSGGAEISQLEPIETDEVVVSGA